jgi:hypothetical protein
VNLSASDEAAAVEDFQRLGDRLAVQVELGGF